MRCSKCGFDLLDSECPVCHARAKADGGRKIGLFTGLFLPLVLGSFLIGLPLFAYVLGTGNGRRIPTAGEAEVSSEAALPAAPSAAPNAALAPAATARLLRQSASRKGVAVDLKPKSIKASALGAAPPATPSTALPAALTAAVRSRVSPPTDSKQAYMSWMLAKSNENPDALSRKWDRGQVIQARGDLRDPELLKAFLFAPREFFARRYNYKKAYDDTAIPIGHGQTISGPHMVMRMTQAIEPRREDRILEIGTGSGYQSSVLAELCDHVYSIEIVSPLYLETDGIFKKLAARFPEYAAVKRRNADGYYGWTEAAPFQKIIVTAGIDHVPPPLLRQLAPGGTMVIPIGPPSGQTLLKIVKRPLPDGGFAFDRSDIMKGRRVFFVPFTATQGGVHSLGDVEAVGK
jgi:protein-L-isoaspartate(D-aspartate) O-methyltransferase